MDLTFVDSYTVGPPPDITITPEMMKQWEEELRLAATLELPDDDEDDLGTPTTSFGGASSTGGFGGFGDSASSSGGFGGFGGSASSTGGSSFGTPSGTSAFSFGSAPENNTTSSFTFGTSTNATPAFSFVGTPQTTAPAFSFDSSKPQSASDPLLMSPDQVAQATEIIQKLNANFPATPLSLTRERVDGIISLLGDLKVRFSVSALIFSHSMGGTKALMKARKTARKSPKKRWRRKDQ